MGTFYEKKERVLTSYCDSDGQLGIPACFDLFMDIATEHQEELGSGVSALARKGKYWVAAKTRLEWTGRPRLLDKITTVTWLESPGAFWNNRDYVLESEGMVVVLGVTQWVILDSQTGRPMKMQEMFPDGLPFDNKQCISDPFTKMPRDLEWRYLGKHLVQSTDIDIAKHMNNVAYVRAIQEQFNVEEWQKMDIRSFEIQYKRPCVEHDQIDFYQSRRGEILYIKAEKGEEIVLQAIIK